MTWIGDNHLEHNVYICNPRIITYVLELLKEFIQT